MRKAAVLLALAILGCTPARPHVARTSPSPPASPAASPTAVAAAPPSFSEPQSGQSLAFRQANLFGSFGWGLVEAPDGMARLVRSSDGGHRWRLLQPGLLPPTFVLYAQDSETAWVVAQDAQGLPVLMRTRDGGRTWQNSGITASDPGTYLFEAGGVVWLSVAGVPGSQFNGQSVVVYRSNDAGATWQKVEDDSSEPNGAPAPGAIPFWCGKQGGISALDGRVAWVAGGCDGRFTFFVTIDGGQTWSPVRLPPLPTGVDCNEGRCGLSAPIFKGGVGRASATAFRGSPSDIASLTLLTYDYGHSWAWQLEPPLTSRIRSIDCSDMPTCTSIGGADSALFVSHDGGRTWTDLKAVLA